MRLLAAGAFLAMAACVPAQGPWDTPWLREPARRVEGVSPLPDGRYPIDLPTVLKLAGANSLDLAYIRQRVHEAHAREALAQERFLPTAGLEYAARRHEGSTQGTDGAFVDVDKQQTFMGARIRLGWQIGDALYASYAASQRREAAGESLKAAENSVALQAALAYFDLLHEQLKRAVLMGSVRISGQIESELDVAVKAGRGFQGDVLRARVQAAGSRIALERADEGVRTAGIRLASLLRLAPGIEVFAGEEIPQPLNLVSVDAGEADLIGRAFAGRPELREAEAEARAGDHERAGAVQGPLFPDIYADAGVGALGRVPTDLDASRDYVVMFGWKVGPGGLLDVGRQRLTEARFRQAEVHLERVRQRIVDEVRTARAQGQSRARRMEIARKSVEDAEEALKLNRERQAALVGLPLEVLQAEESLTKARLEYFGAVVDYNQAQVRLIVALGGRP